MTSHSIAIKSFGISVAFAMLSMFVTTSAQAADGCKFLLCIAGSWNNISECRPTVREVLRDLSRGHPLPPCDMSGPGNTATNTPVDEASCPSMYRVYNLEPRTYSYCQYQARISVYVDGQLWTQVFWNQNADTATWYSDAARARLTEQPSSPPLDDRFLNQVTEWNAAQVPQCRAAGGTVVFDAFGAFERCNYPNWEPPTSN